MLFRGCSDPKSYGKLIAWSDHPDAFTWMTSRKEHQPGEGLLILEVQERLMAFLVSCVKQILPDISDEQLSNQEIQPEPVSVSESGGGLGSLAVMAAEAPYRVPSQLSFERIESLLAAKLDQITDHLWSLREDPGYFEYCIRDDLEHRQELLKDSNGQAHPLFQRHREEIIWGRVLGHIIASSYTTLELWSVLHQQSLELKQIHSKHHSHLSPGDDLPEGYLHALLKFRSYTREIAKIFLHELKTSVVASPPWRRYYERDPVTNPTDPMIRTKQKAGAKFNKVEIQLMWLLCTLWEDGDTLFFLRLTDVMDELQRLLNTSSEAQSLISSYVATIVADLSILVECIHQINLYQPWANNFDDAMVDLNDSIKEEFIDLAHMLNDFSNIFKGSSERTLVGHGAPTEVDFRYPIGKRRTKENVTALRAAEANLDTFWTKVDQIAAQKSRTLQGTAIQALLTESRSLRRTPEWTDPSKSGIEKDVPDVNRTIKPLSEMYLDLQQRTEQTLAVTTPTPEPKSKAKTRGQPQLKEDIRPNGPSTDANDHDLQPTFAVDSRALKVFKTLFFTSSLTATPGGISWTDFLHAMVSTGFQPEKLYGSVWQFSPTDLDVERAIQFHEPHPSGKIPYFIARRHGRQLNRAYGWHGNMFVLAEKTVDPKS